MRLQMQPQGPSCMGTFMSRAYLRLNPFSKACIMLAMPSSSCSPCCHQHGEFIFMPFAICMLQLWAHSSAWIYACRLLQVMPYSTGCTTVLSNFEAGLNYKEVSDPAVYVAFPLDDDPDAAQLVIWTTTPWTLPSNLAICVHPEFTYVKVSQSKFTSIHTTYRLATHSSAMCQCK